MNLKPKYTIKDNGNEDHIELSDRLDLIKTYIKVHDKRKGGLDENQVLAHHQTNEKEFVRKQHLAAKDIYAMVSNINIIRKENYLKGGIKDQQIEKELEREKEEITKIADQAYDLAETEYKDLAILNRNHKDNQIVIKGFELANRTNDTITQETEEQKGIVDQVKSLAGRLTGKQPKEDED